MMKGRINRTMSASDIIEIISIIASTAVSTIAIVISLKTLRQNSRALEESTRPYISMYLSCTYCSGTTVFLVMKNYGNSSAVITDFKSGMDLSICAYDKEFIPFSHIVGTNLAPNEAIKYPVQVENLPSDIAPVTMSISYQSHSTTYHEDTTINFLAHFDIAHFRYNSKENLQEISYSLQDISERLL